VTDFMAGRVDFVIDSQTLLAPLVRDGRARGLAVTTTRRSQLLPDLPTLQEAGVAGYAASSWQALYAPAGTPTEIIAALSTAVTAVLNDPAIRQRFAE
jgi:tripartite-type tricarboxylate transporter receptor subunit TctC